MKSICLIASHTPTKEKQDALRKLVRVLKKEQKDIFLISHSHTPSDIISDVNYYFYDSENEFLFDDIYKGWYFIPLYGNTIVTKDVIKQSTSLLPCTRNLFFGLHISKMLGYDVLHYLEYDMEINDISIIDENTNLMSEYDGVYYLTKRGFGDEHYHLFGPYSVYNLNSYSFEELLWDRQKILHEFENPYNNTLVEKVTESLLIKNKNFLSFDKSILSDKGINVDTIKSYSDSPIDLKVLFYDDEKVHLYCLNQSSVNEHIDVIINDNSYLKIPVMEPNVYHFLTIGEIKDVKKIKLLSNNKFIFEYRFESEEEINRFKENNYFIKNT